MGDLNLFLLAQYVLGLYFVYDSVTVSYVADASGKKKLGASIEWFGFLFGLVLLLLTVLQKVL